MMDIRRIDLNLLIAFDALMSTRNVSRAAEQLHVGQSAMSHSLRRLRELLDDPLLVRTSGGMSPTPRALALKEPIHNTLEDLQQTLAPSPAFIPAEAEHRFHLMASDYVVCVLLPRLMERVKVLAPKVSLVIRTSTTESPEAPMERGEIDLTLNFERSARDSGRLHRQALFREHLVCLMRRGHPALSRRLTLKRYMALDHLLVSTTERETGIVDDHLSAQGYQRHISLVIPHFLAAPIIVSRTDMAVTLPARVAEEFASMTELELLDLPLTLGEYTVEMMWHPIRDKDPAHCWIRKIVTEVANAVAS